MPTGASAISRAIAMLPQKARSAEGLDPTADVLGDGPNEPPVLWTIKNKLDLIDPAQRELYEYESALLNMTFAISASTGERMNHLIESLARFAAEYFGSEPALVSRERHRKALEVAWHALNRALTEGAKGREDIIAEELRLAARTLGRLSGRVDVEDILDAIFRDFCIGK